MRNPVSSVNCNLLNLYENFCDVLSNKEFLISSKDFCFKGKFRICEESLMHLIGFEKIYKIKTSKNLKGKEFITFLKNGTSFASFYEYNYNKKDSSLNKAIYQSKKKLFVLYSFINCVKLNRVYELHFFETNQESFFTEKALLSKIDCTKCFCKDDNNFDLKNVLAFHENTKAKKYFASSCLLYFNRINYQTFKPINEYLDFEIIS